MTKKVTTGQISVYVPVSRMGERIIERLVEIGDKRRRSVNWLCVEAIDEYLERHEAEYKHA